MEKENLPILEGFKDDKNKIFFTLNFNGKKCGILFEKIRGFIITPTESEAYKEHVEKDDYFFELKNSDLLKYEKGQKKATNKTRHFVFRCELETITVLSDFEPVRIK